MKSFRNPDTHTLFALLKDLKSSKLLVFERKTCHGLPDKLNVMKSTVSLSLFAHMYVCIGQKYSVSKVLFSLLVCMYWPSRTSTPSQSEIFSQIRSNVLPFPCSYKQREYFTLGGSACPGRPIHTYEQREQDL